MQSKTKWFGWKDKLRRRVNRLLSAPPSRHPTIWTAKVPGSALQITEIATEVPIPVFASGEDRGYHEFSNAWWSNTRCPYAFQYPDIDSMYAGAYFQESEVGHPDAAIA